MPTRNRFLPGRPGPDMDAVRLPDWLIGLGLLAAGIAHLAVPGVLLTLARRGYDRVLAVEFAPRAGAKGRVRAVGVGMLLAGLLLLRRCRDGDSLLG